MKPRLYLIFVSSMVAGLAIGVAQLEIDKSKLRRQIFQLSPAETNLARQRTETARNQALVARFETSHDEGAKAIRAELLQAKAELAALEAKAAHSTADASATPSIESNRDPTKALTRPDFLSDVGRATPEAAFQTLIWAAMKGRDPEMAACLALDSVARAKAENFLATLPADARAKYRTPEQLAALSFAYGALESTAFQFATSSIAADGDHATLAVRVRANGQERETRIPMVRSATGWAIMVSEKQIDILRGVSAANPPKR